MQHSARRIFRYAPRSSSSRHSLPGPGDGSDEEEYYYEIAPAPPPPPPSSSCCGCGRSALLFSLICVTAILFSGNQLSGGSRFSSNRRRPLFGTGSAIMAKASELLKEVLDAATRLDEDSSDDDGAEGSAVEADEYLVGNGSEIDADAEHFFNLSLAKWEDAGLAPEDEEVSPETAGELAPAPTDFDGALTVTANRSATASPSRRPTPSPRADPRVPPPGLSGPAASPRRCPRGRKYIHLLTTREGMAAWTHILYEMLYLAKLTGRVLVEPCVAGGQLLPCSPGRVVPVPESTDDTDAPITAFTDPLNVPAFQEHCSSNGEAGKAITHRKGHSYPLRLYMDLRVLREAVPIVSFDEWAACELGRPRGGGKNTPPRDVRWQDGAIIAEHGYCVLRPGAPPNEFKQCQRTGRYRFNRIWRPPRELPVDPSLPPPAAAMRRKLLLTTGSSGLVSTSTASSASGASAGARPRDKAGYMLRYFRDTLLEDTRANMFIFAVWRGSFRAYGTFQRTPRFNNIHRAAVHAWLTERLDPTSDGHYATFQWRSEEVPNKMMLPCAQLMATKARPLVKKLARSNKAGAVLVADVPAANNPCRMWRVYSGSSSEGGARREALDTLTDMGMVKYDEDHPGVDSGVLSIRDWILGLDAKWYVTCHGDDDACRQCFRANSKFIRRVIASREKAGRVSFTNWFDVTMGQLMSAPPARPAVSR